MKAFFKKMFAENPVFVLLLGMCPTLGTSTSVINGLGMGLSATAVLICSNFFISILRKFIPAKIRIASYIVIIAGFVTAVDMALKAYLPEISASLGVFIPLIVVNCIILARAESFASKNTPGKSAVDGLCMGLGFTAALVILSAIRELLGNGSLLGLPVLGSNYPKAIMMILPPGGFIVLGVVLGVIQLMRTKGGAKNG
ncbi:MAG: electron transport complex subunit RsxE [Clostridia bacterium]|nr:electron transport complex subunit RsxE [Clostridia bacterium]